MKLLYIFDKDGTLCQSKTGKEFINSVDDQELMPSVYDKIHELKIQGKTIAVASNQGGVAFGYMTYSQAQRIMDHCQNLIDADWYMFCPYHPKATLEQYKIDSADRKPNPGMLFAALKQFNCDSSQAIYIGDRPEDEEAARRAGIDFIWAKDFFKS